MLHVYRICIDTISNKAVIEQYIMINYLNNLIQNI